MDLALCVYVKSNKGYSRGVVYMGQGGGCAQLAPAATSGYVWRSATRRNGDPKIDNIICGQVQWNVHTQRHGLRFTKD